MSNCVDVIVLSEGQTEKKFINTLLNPYFSGKNIFLHPAILGKPDKKGGDVRFCRVKEDIETFLKQRPDTYVTLMIDYYGIKNANEDDVKNENYWPGLKKSKQQATHSLKAEVINIEISQKVQELFPEQNRGSRFIPYVSMYEIEALYFSDPVSLARVMDAELSEIESILSRYPEPEAINDSSQTAPSKRLEKLSPKFGKTVTGITIAKEIGVSRMRERCPLFNKWISRIENLSPLINSEP
ncbi:MAG: DUF4276 family protein [Chitinispirillales bacterium]|jgi:hypothetical protein|nr:DUF4276 family protein [Chitinispirillales bacterium]